MSWRANATPQTEVIFREPIEPSRPPVLPQRKSRIRASASLQGHPNREIPMLPLMDRLSQSIC
jgi:hypothetical protein